jgi:hypothetical protein
MSLIKRPNSSNWYYLFQIQGRKYFGSTQTPKKDVGQAPLLADQLRGVVRRPHSGRRSRRHPLVDAASLVATDHVC